MHKGLVALAFLMFAAIGRAQTAADIRMASWQPGSDPVVYPPLLDRANVKGMVDVWFVVDTAGRVDMSSFRAASWTHELFVQSARDAVAAGRPTRAVISGVPRRQQVRHRFVFAPYAEAVCQGEKPTVAPLVTLVCAPRAGRPLRSDEANCAPPMPFPSASSPPCPPRRD